MDPREFILKRRALLKMGGAALLSQLADKVAWPPEVAAAFAGAEKSRPRGTARNVIVLELGGAMSHTDCFDFKENAGTPKDLDATEVARDLYVSRRLFPKTLELGVMKHVAIVRTVRSNEEVHFRGQYYTQAGRPFNPAFAREIPPIGSVVAYELEGARRETDSFPTFVGLGLGNSRAAVIPPGFLPTRFAGMDINPASGVTSMGATAEDAVVLGERYRLAEELGEVLKEKHGLLGKDLAEYRSFFEFAYRMLRDPRWTEALSLSDEDKKRYGGTDFGNGCALARNLVAADAGTRYCHVYSGNWDHHSNIWDLKKGHYYTCGEQFDPAYANLLHDLFSMPSRLSPGRTLLDDTLVVVMGEFGRTPGGLNWVKGRDHWNKTFHVKFAGGGVAGGRIVGRTDSEGRGPVEMGWEHADQPWIENVYATVYSALGIDWRKEFRNTWSGRTYYYTDTLGQTRMINDDQLPVFA